VVSGQPVYRFRRRTTALDGALKNLIFAANGPKPEIAIRDAPNNNLQITRNGNYCLIYDSALPADGLRWGTLLNWWTESHSDSPQRSRAAEGALYRRHYQALALPPETMFTASAPSNPPTSSQRQP
jgi:hypothetical protein